MTERTKEQLNLAFWLLVLAAIVGFSFAIGQGQTCTPPIGQGSVNTTSDCHRLTILFLNKQSSSLIDHYETRWTIDGVRHVLPGSATSDTRGDLPGGAASQLEITQFNKNGAVCSMVTTTSPAPHAAPCGVGPSAGVSIVSSANYRGNVTRGSLASIFPDPGVAFTDRSEHAGSIPLPTSLAGVSVEMDGHTLGLLDVTPGQINFLLPDSLPDGPTEMSLTVNSTRGSVGQFHGRVQLNPQAPGVFTRDATGGGVAAAVWLVARIDGSQRYYNLGALPPLSPSDLVFILLYGTGFNGSDCVLNVGGTQIAGRCDAALGFAGLSQFTALVPQSQLWQSNVGAYVRLRLAGGGYYDSQGFNLIR